MKPYYEQDGIQLFFGDCREIMPTLEPRSFGLILTDPPYGMTDLSWDCEIPMAELWKDFERLTTDFAATVLTASQPYTSAVVMSRPKWFRSEWIWHKNAGSNFATTKWHPMKEHESVLVFGRGPTTYNPIKQPRATPIKAGYTNRSNTGKRKAYSGVSENKGFTVKDGGMRVPSSVQKFNRERGLHPNQKPVSLFEYFVRTYSNEGDTVLDCFAGSGTTAIACRNAGRKCVLIEKDEAYCKEIVKRLGPKTLFAA